jgi:hypothetical protein
MYLNLDLKQENLYEVFRIPDYRHEHLIVVYSKAYERYFDSPLLAIKYASQYCENLNELSFIIFILTLSYYTDETIN